MPRPFFSTVAQKIFVGLSGLLLCGFLVAHLAGNLLIYAPGPGYSVYNKYAEALHASPLLPVFEIGLLTIFLAHVVLTIVLVVKNARARPDRYAVKASKRGKTGLTAHNVMHISGTIVLVFIALHLLDFRFHIRFPEQPGQAPADRALFILHDPVSAVVYTIGSLLLGYHLFHGVRSGFESLGASNARIASRLAQISLVFAVVIAIGFASFPVWANLFLK